MLEHSLIISFIVLFLHACSWDGMIFAGIKKIVKPQGLAYKPLYGCPICMSPYWGITVYVSLFSAGFKDWILTIFCAAGISVVWVLLIDLKDYIEKFSQSE